MANKRSIRDTVVLGNAVRAPQLGFGVYKSPPDVCVRSCRTALESGYRRIDTAQFYGNEAQVGQAVRESGIPRADVFLVSKILQPAGSVDRSFDKCVESVGKLDAQGYVDQFLVHSPNSGAASRKEMWLALERLHEQGKAKAIGVSNYGIKHLEELKQYATLWPPHANQIELHPWMQQREIVQYCEKHGIVVEAYCPLVRNKKADDATLRRLADRHGVTPNQVLVRYGLQKGWVPLPKSDTPERIRANADVFGFDLDADDMDALDALDQGRAGAIVQPVDN